MPQEHPQGLKSTIQLVAFDKPINLRNAVKIVEAKAQKVLAFRYENHDIVGEYSVGSGKSINAFLAEFSANYGTQPEITGLVIERPAPSSDEKKIRIAPLKTGLAAFDAPPITLSAQMKPLAEVPTAAGGVAAQSTGDWRPTTEPS